MVVRRPPDATADRRAPADASPGPGEFGVREHGGAGESAGREARTQIRASTTFLFGRALSLAVNLLTQTLVVRHLSRTDYGAFAYALALSTTAGTFVTLGLDRGLARFLAMYDEEGEQPKAGGVLLMTVGTIAGLGLAVVLVAASAESWVSRSLIDNPTAGSLLAILIVLAPLQALDNAFIDVLAVYRHTRAVFLRKYVLTPVLRLAVVSLLVVGGGGPTFMAVGYVVAGAVGIIVYGGLLVRILRERGVLRYCVPRFADIPYREFLTFSVPLFAVDLVAIAHTTADTVMVGFFAGAAQVAALGAVLPAARLNQLVMQSFYVLFTPLASRLYARGDRQGLNDFHWQSAAWIAVLSFPIFAVTFSMSRSVVVTLFGEQYRDAGILLGILAIGHYVQAAFGFNGISLRVGGRVRYLVTISVLSALTNVGLNLVLVPAHGALGAVSATTATFVLFNILRQVGLPPMGINMFDRSYRRVYGVILAAAAALALFDALVSPGLGAAAAAAGLASAFVLVTNRDALRLGSTFPELARVPIVGRLLAG